MPVLPEPFPLLIVSASGRALAQSASRMGLKAVVLDLFDDMDMRALADASQSVAGRNARFDARKLLAAAQALSPPERCSGLVYGSGFEGRTRLLVRLARGRRLFGNAPETIAQVKDPLRFFAMLDSLGIAHPEFRLEAPPEVTGWLTKRSGGAGGSHVKPMRRRDRARPQRYFQKFQTGRTLSVLFLADGHNVRVIGFNEQWCADVAQCALYCYGGAVSGIPVTPALRACMAAAVEKLVRATGLVGLNGLDFILDADDLPHVLEINPRPTATIDLYDADFPAGLLALHLRACHGELPQLLPSQHRSRAHAIVYAAENLVVPAGVKWPGWCTDIPARGFFIAAGAPVCSVHAEAASSRDARELALRRRGLVTDLVRQKAA